MKLATFTSGGRRRVAAVQGDEVADLSAATQLPTNLGTLLSQGPEALEAARPATASAPRLPLEEVHLQAPVPDPGKFLAVGLNYASSIVDEPESTVLI